MTCVALFGICKVIFHFPPSTDDFVYLRANVENRLNLDFFGAYLARVPLWCYVTFELFTSSLSTLENLIYPAGFAWNAGFLLLFARRIRRLMFGRIQTSLWFWLLAGIFTFFPNDHEVLFWLTCLPYAVGLGFLWCAWICRIPVMKILFYTAAYACGEMYLMPSLALELLTVVYPKPGPPPPPGRHELGQALQKTFFWLLAVGLFLAMRRILSLAFGTYPHSYVRDFGVLPQQFLHMLEHFFVMDYYKIFWTPTLLYWTALVIVTWTAAKHATINRLTVVYAALFMLTCGSLVFAMGYFAPRALFGASLCVNAFLIVLIERALYKTRILTRWSVLILIGGSFFGQSVLIYSLKDTNSKILGQKEENLVTHLRQCAQQQAQECVVETTQIPQGLTRGWVLHSDYVEDYVGWIAARYGITVPIRYVP